MRRSERIRGIADEIGGALRSNQEARRDVRAITRMNGFAVRLAAVEGQAGAIGRRLASAACDYYGAAGKRSDAEAAGAFVEMQKLVGAIRDRADELSRAWD